ncbi:hypothetical protein FHS57_001389 [Runella defluvii]|uniref:Uncharacterized protein n=1 Tax=Runella defluvii TaxID=370973 RepID=A0A7W5ZHT8_9BACT|nr:hypothetical protein [Runella defluvii]MBB3837395.1 hypothetical protein [Runella defluvii]
MKAIERMVKESSMLNENQKSLITSVKEVGEIDIVSVKSLQEIYSKRLLLLKEVLNKDYYKQSKIQYFLNCLEKCEGNNIKYCAFYSSNRRIGIFFDFNLTEVFFVTDGVIS